MPAVNRIRAPWRRQSWSSRVRLIAGLAVATLTVVGGCSAPSAADSGTAQRPAMTSVGADGGLKANTADTVAKQCSRALTSAAGFMPTWKLLANQGTSPTAEQRQALATEIQTYIDQLAAQLDKITDTTLASAVQAVQGEMGTLVFALNAGTAVDLAAYNKAVGTAKGYCDK